MNSVPMIKTLHIDDEGFDFYLNLSRVQMVWIWRSYGVSENRDVYDKCHWCRLVRFYYAATFFPEPQHEYGAIYQFDHDSR